MKYTIRKIDYELDNGMSALLVKRPTFNGKGKVMAYASENFRTKKAFKEAVKSGKEITLRNPSGMFPTEQNGRETVEGPWYPEPHKWYASVTVKNGIVTDVK